MARPRCSWNAGPRWRRRPHGTRLATAAIAKLAHDFLDAQTPFARWSCQWYNDSASTGRPPATRTSSGSTEVCACKSARLVGPARASPAHMRVPPQDVRVGSSAATLRARPRSHRGGSGGAWLLGSGGTSEFHHRREVLDPGVHLGLRFDRLGMPDVGCGPWARPVSAPSPCVPGSPSYARSTLRFACGCAETALGPSS